MKRVIVFIDGTWLWHNVMQFNLSNDHKLDLGNLPSVLVNELSKYSKEDMNYQHVTTILSASIPINVAPEDTAPVEKRYRFFDLLKNKYGFTLDLHEIDFKGRRLKKSDRSYNDFWQPKEKCVDIAMASNLFYYMHSYDVAIAVTGDRDFMPAFDKVKLMGKELVIASFAQSFSKQYEAYPHILIDKLIDEGKLTLI